MLTVENLSVRYGRIEALSGVDLTARPGEILALIGANGSGKSSFLKAVAGLVPRGGAVIPPLREGAPARLGYMPQDIAGRAALSVVETVLLGRLKRLGYRVGRGDLETVEAALERLGITRLANRQLVELSGGQRQLVFLAQAMVGDPHLLCLDEPISALDIRNQLQVMDTVRSLTRERHLVTLAVLHDLNIAARYADRIAILRDGKLLICAPAQEALSPAILRQAFAIETARSAGAEGHVLIEALRAVH